MVVLDIDMPELDGIAVATEIAASEAATRVVFFTGHPVGDVHTRARHLGPYHLVRKQAAQDLVAAVIAAAR